MIPLAANKKLVLFDGVCNLCQTSVQFIIKHDKKNLFMFASLQSATGLEIINANKIDPNKTDSIVLFMPEKGVLLKSDAVLEIAKHLGFPINIFSIFRFLPQSIRNGLYDFIAKHRYKWFGKKTFCWLPSPELKSKFLE